MSKRWRGGEKRGVKFEVKKTLKKVLTFIIKYDI